MRRSKIGLQLSSVRSPGGAGPRASARSAPWGASSSTWYDAVISRITPTDWRAVDPAGAERAAVAHPVDLEADRLGVVARADEVGVQRVDPERRVDGEACRPAGPGPRSARRTARPTGSAGPSPTHTSVPWGSSAIIVAKSISPSRRRPSSLPRRGTPVGVPHAVVHGQAVPEPQRRRRHERAGPVPQEGGVDRVGPPVAVALAGAGGGVERHGVGGVAGMVEHAHPDRPPVGRARQVAPARRLRRHPRPRPAVVEDQPGVDPVLASPEAPGPSTRPRRPCTACGRARRRPPRRGG